jgi:uncharacterized protein Usg
MDMEESTNMAHRSKQHSTAGGSLWEKGYRLTLAEIEVEDMASGGERRTLYWQDLDHAPDFPVLSSYLNDWRATHLKTNVCSVRVATYDAITPEQLSLARFSLAVH